MEVPIEGAKASVRFYHAIDLLKRMRVLRGLNTFAEKYNIRYWDMWQAKQTPLNHRVRVEWIVYLVNDYGVSAEYIMSGTLPVFKDEEKEKLAAALTGGRQ